LRWEITMNFWQQYGPNHLEAIALGVAGGVALVQRVGPGWVAGVAVAVAVVSYVVRRYVKS
jgi:hypothetical protein